MLMDQSYAAAYAYLTQNDYRQALLHFEVAAKQGDTMAHLWLEQLYYVMDSIR